MIALNSGTRLGTMIIDHFFMCFIIMFIVAPGMIYDIIQLTGLPALSNLQFEMSCAGYMMNGGFSDVALNTLNAG